MLPFSSQEIEEILMSVEGRRQEGGCIIHTMSPTVALGSPGISCFLCKCILVCNGSSLECVGHEMTVTVVRGTVPGYGSQHKKIKKA